MNSVGWIEEVNSRGVADMAQFLGLETGQRGPRGMFLKPCPACGAVNRHPSRGDTRGAGGLTPDGMGWRCHECNEGGDAVTLASWKLCGASKPPAWSTLRELLRDHIAAPAPVRAPFVADAAARPPPDELKQLWDASVPLKAPSAARAAAYLRGRGIEPNSPALDANVVRVLPPASAFDFPEWWPKYWSDTWRIAVPAFNAHGEMVSIHARAIRGDVQPKTRWPMGMSAAGLFFADAFGMTFLQSWSTPDQLGGLEEVIVTEGLTDTLRMATVVHAVTRTRAVLGITSGSVDALRTIQWPVSVPCVVATDADPAGDAYAAAIRAALPAEVRVSRFRLPSTGSTR